jgi:hypothetical protein
MSTLQTLLARTTLRFGVFMLLALPVVQAQTGNATPPAEVKKDGTAPAVKKPADGGASGSQANASADATKSDPAKVSLAARLENARLDAVDSDYSSMSLTDCVPAQPDPHKIICNGKAVHPKVSDLGLRAKLKEFHVGDHLRVDINDKGDLQDLRGAWSVPSDEIGPAYRLMVLALCGLAILALAAAVTRGAPLKFIVGMDNRYSNSKFQLALWFWVALSTYLAVVVFRVWYAGWDFFGAVNIPQHLLELSGLSAITYGGAKAITTAKVNAAMNPTPVAVPIAAAAPAPVAVPAGGATVTVVTPGGPAHMALMTPAAIPDPKSARNPGEESFFRDLVENDQGVFDFGDFQMLVVTFVAVAMYLMLIFHFLGSIEFLKTASLPDVDTTILAGFGLGQGAYLTKKAAGNVGTS